MNVKKIALIIVSILLMGSLFVGSVFASYVDVSHFALSNYNNGNKLSIEHPSGVSGRNSALAETFGVTNAGYLTSITVYANRNGNPLGSLRLMLCGVNSLSTAPNGTVFEVSVNSITMSTISSSIFDTCTFTFSGDFYLPLDARFAWVVYVDSASYIDLSPNYIDIAAKNTESGADFEGYEFYYVNGVWGGFPQGDLCFQVNGDSIPTTTPSPTPPPPTVTPSPSPAPTMHPTPTPEMGGLFNMDYLTYFIWAIIVVGFLILVAVVATAKMRNDRGGK